MNRRRAQVKELLLEKRRGASLSEVSGHKLPLETGKGALPNPRGRILSFLTGRPFISPVLCLSDPVTAVPPAGNSHPFCLVNVSFLLCLVFLYTLP